MKRDMELMRKILLAIEEKYKPGSDSMAGPKIDEYDMAIIAEHCDLLYQQGFIKSYKPNFSRGQGLWNFTVGNLTSKGYDFLETVRNNDVWEKSQKEIHTRKLPNTFEEIVRVIGVFVGNVIREMNG